MKRKTLAILLALVLATTLGMVSALPVMASAEPQLVARWDFDEGLGSIANDRTGINDGTINGATWSADVPDVPYGSSLLFDGDDYIQIPGSSSMDVSDPYTFEAWVKIDDSLLTNEHYVGIFRRGELGTNSEIEIYTQPYNTAQNGYFTVVHNRGGDFTYRYFPALPRDTWVHVGVAWDGTSWSVYYNKTSQLAVSGPGSFSPTATNSNSFIGIGYAGSNQYTPGYMRGNIDEVRIWGSVLDSTLLDDMIPPTINSNVESFGVYPAGYLLDFGVEDSKTGVKDVEAYLDGSPVNDGDPLTVGIGDLVITATDYALNTYSETFQNIVVYDPSAGFVTGGGWIDSPSGAYRPTYLYPDQTLSEWQSSNFPEVFDLTKGDLTLSYTIDMSGITTAGWAVTEVGLREVGAPNIDPNELGGWMQSNYMSNADNPDDQDLNDFHLLSKHGWSLQYYDADGPESLITPYWSGDNYAFWFDRGGVNPWQDDDPATPSPGGSLVPWGVGDSVTYNTGGVYDIVITYHAIDAITATMFATINGIPQGLYIGGWKDDQPEFYPSGRSFIGDMTQMQVFFGRGSGGGTVVLSDIEALYLTNLIGKANFGFVSKYQKKNTDIPIGQTEFQFKAGDLNFHSSSYEWLVVNKGDARAQFKGTGTINGEGEFKFMLWAGDGEPDTFRIKIWYEVDDTEYVVYDNETDQVIGGGSIVVHTSKK